VGDATDDSHLPKHEYLLLPILYGVLGFVMTAIGAAIYNLVASWIGGIEIQMDDSDSSLSSNLDQV
jgi:hypothetical protein